eukprot:snap_masked-scaffold_14-processed-gene-0.6-mRNA-1 protein AED:1.00 eAED:1.00 QI:0/0/0/0/1/1/2/0/99
MSRQLSYSRKYREKKLKERKYQVFRNAKLKQDIVSLTLEKEKLTNLFNKVCETKNCAFKWSSYYTETQNNLLRKIVFNQRCLRVILKKCAEFDSNLSKK